MARRLIIVVRADPVICGHSGEARNLAEAALERGFTDVRILSWPMAALEASGLPLKPLSRVLPYREPIVVERPEPVGDYKVPDGRYCTGLTSRLIDIAGDGVDTVVLSLYLLPHTSVVTDAVTAAQRAGLPIRVTTVAEAVGSDITNVMRGCIDSGRYGAAIYLFSNYLAQDLCLAVSDYTRELIIESAERVDVACGTRFAPQCRKRVEVSYPAVDTRELMRVDRDWVSEVLARRGLLPGGFILFLSRMAPAKGVYDLIEAYRASRCEGRFKLVMAGSGPALGGVRELAEGDPNLVVLSDVDDGEKKALMQACAVYALPSKPQPEFVETFGIALVEKLLAGGRGPIVTTDTGGIPEAVGDAAVVVEAGSVVSIAQALEYAALEMSDVDKERLAWRGRAHALRFDRSRILDGILERLPSFGASAEAEVG